MNIEFRQYKISLFNPAESDAFFNLIDKNRSRLEDFFAGTVAKTKTLIDTKNYCEEIIQKIADKEYFPYFIQEKQGGPFIGLIDVKNIDWSIPKAEIGYLIDSEFEGKGIVSEAFGYVVEHLIEKYRIKKLFCRISTQNSASISVVLKNHFELEGTIRCDYKTTNNGVVDLNYYGRVFE